MWHFSARPEETTDFWPGCQGCFWDFVPLICCVNFFPSSFLCLCFLCLPIPVCLYSASLGLPLFMLMQHHVPWSSEVPDTQVLLQLQV